MVNLMSAPGAGKTTLLRETLARFGGQLRVGIIEGDIETSLDADRLAGFGAAIALINTGNGFGGECHLDAPMVRSALPRLPLAELDVVVIENVGNLVLTSTWTGSSATCARSTRRPRSCRSVPAPGRASLPGATG